MRHAKVASGLPPSRSSVALGFLAIYLIWGSTYLAIRFGVESMPPFLMAGSRFVLAGGILYAWSRLRGAAAPTARQWGAAAVIGNLMLLGGNGLVTWAEQWVPSGVTALLIASVPLWVALFQWVFEPAHRPRSRGIMGLVLGFAGVGLLVNPRSGIGGDRAVLIGSLALILASAFWAAGSLYSRHADTPKEPLLSTAMQMLLGSAGLLVAGVATGEIGRLDLGAVTTRSFVSFLYLVTFGSIIGFTSYIWLLRVTTPAKAATYAYVNPVVAVLLGWALAGERLDGRMLAAAVVIIGAVVLIQTERGTTKEAEEPGPRQARSSALPSEEG